MFISVELKTLEVSYVETLKLTILAVVFFGMLTLNQKDSFFKVPLMNPPRVVFFQEIIVVVLVKSVFEAVVPLLVPIKTSPLGRVMFTRVMFAVVFGLLMVKFKNVFTIPASIILGFELGSKLIALASPAIIKRAKIASMASENLFFILPFLFKLFLFTR